MATPHTLWALMGKTNNFDEPTPSWNKQTVLVPTISVFLSLSWACVIFRIWTRFRIIYSPGWDDLFVVFTLLSSSVGSICICLATNSGFGKHFLTLPYSDMQTYLKLFYAANASYSLSSCLVKAALLLQYLRIYKDGPLRLITIIVLVLTALWGTAYTFMAFVPCFPVYAYWNPLGMADATCYAYGATTAEAFYGTYASASATNMIIDIIILAIPVPLYFQKDTPTRARMALLGLLVMGGLVNFLSIWRTATVVEHKAATYPTFDPTWYGPISILLATLEVDLATICASVPVFWPVLTSKLDRIFVTQEIKIEREHRFSTIDDEYELQRQTTGDDGLFTSLSRSTSQSSLHRADSKGPQAAAKEMHYKDRYIIAQVDPLSAAGKVESEISSHPPRRKCSKSGV